MEEFNLQSESALQPESSIQASIHPSGSSTLLTRRKFVYTGIVGLSGFALAGCMHGITTRGDVEITHRTFSMPALPPAFEGFTLTLASDIHSSPFMLTDDLKKVVKLINGLGSDAIVMPGDFVTSHHNEIPPFAEAMSNLKAPYGVFCCTGNHDYYCGVDAVTKASEEIGLKMLRNENFAIEKDGQKIFLIGVDDEDAAEVEQYIGGKRASHIEAAYKGIDRPEAAILLCHKPYEFESFAKTNVGLMLSGHTHGGQIVFGRIGDSVLSLSTIASHFVEGRYLPKQSESATQLYVSRGLGVVGLPIRINCPPEITKITLTRQPTLPNLSTRA